MASTATSSTGSPAQVNPHRVIEAADEKQRFTLELFDALWNDYRQQISYVQMYEQVIAGAGATFVNDHIAFRTLAGQEPFVGIATLARIFEALGYAAAGCYQFPDKQLSSIHFQHPHPQFPKLFISELRSWELSARAQEIITEAVASHRPVISTANLAKLHRVDQAAPGERTELQETLVRFFQELPWNVPSKEAVAALNQESQFGAWVLVHGYRVNHFTALVNSHGVAELGDIEKTIAAMRQAGVPMKTEIEGERGSKLRQTATEAVRTEVQVSDQGAITTMPWTYAYFEIAERGEIADPATGRKGRFEGFLGPQATQLFEMTKVR